MKRISFLRTAHSRTADSRTTHFTRARTGRFIKDKFPTANVTSECNSASVVVITSGSTEIAKVPQRDLYRKYGWPAEKKIKDLLEMYGEEMSS